MSADGNYIVSGQFSTSNNITLFNRISGFMWNYTASSSVRSVAISQDGQYIAAGGSNNVTLFKQDGTKLWEYNTGKTIWDVAISADGQHIVAGDDNYNITLFNRAGFMWNYTTEGHIGDVAISSDGQYIGVTGDQHVYLFYNDIYPDSNTPGSINTLTTESVNISWFLQDIVGPGKYRVWANDTNGNYYVWRDWADWANGSDLQVEINRTATGIFNYTIEYNNSRGYFGIPNTVIVKITKPSPSQLNPLLLILGMQQTGNQFIIVLIVGIGVAVAVVILIVIIKKG
jgi:WD40 repeat protein